MPTLSSWDHGQFNSYYLIYIFVYRSRHEKHVHPRHEYDFILKKIKTSDEPERQICFWLVSNPPPCTQLQRWLIISPGFSSESDRHTPASSLTQKGENHVFIMSLLCKRFLNWTNRAGAIQTWPGVAPRKRFEVWEEARFSQNLEGEKK